MQNVGHACYSLHAPKFYFKQNCSALHKQREKARLNQSGETKKNTSNRIGKRSFIKQSNQGWDDRLRVGHCAPVLGGEIFERSSGAAEMIVVVTLRLVNRGQTIKHVASVLCVCSMKNVCFVFSL